MSFRFMLEFAIKDINKLNKTLKKTLFVINVSLHVLAKNDVLSKGQL